MLVKFEGRNSISFEDIAELALIFCLTNNDLLNIIIDNTNQNAVDNSINPILVIVIFFTISSLFSKLSTLSANFFKKSLKYFGSNKVKILTFLYA